VATERLVTHLGRLGRLGRLVTVEGKSRDESVPKPGSGFGAARAQEPKARVLAGEGYACQGQAHPLQPRRLAPLLPPPAALVGAAAAAGNRGKPRRARSLPAVPARTRQLRCRRRTAPSPSPPSPSPAPSPSPSPKARHACLLTCTSTKPASCLLPGDLFETRNRSTSAPAGDVVQHQAAAALRDGQEGPLGVPRQAQHKVAAVQHLVRLRGQSLKHVMSCVWES
jgi:hypothetical protein